MRNKTAPIAKITPPKVEGIISRKRLFDLLDSCKNYPVIWISGPAGCGKTSLITSYIVKRNITCVWYQMSEGDEDLASFSIIWDWLPKGLLQIEESRSQF